MDETDFVAICRDPGAYRLVAEPNGKRWRWGEQCPLPEAWTVFPVDDPVAHRPDGMLQERWWILPRVEERSINPETRELVHDLRRLIAKRLFGDEDA
jgi:hypothetical protein